MFDVASGAADGTFDLSGLVFFGATLSRAGRELYLTSAGRLRRIDLASGQTLADVALPTQFNGWPETSLWATADPRSGIVYAFGEGIYRFDPATLQLLSANVAPWAPPVRGPFGPPNPGLRWLQFDPHRPRIYASSNEVPVHDWMLTGDGLVLVDAIQPYSAAADSGVLIVAPRPAAPAALAATVSASTVALAWSAVESNAITLRYVLEAGSAPGLADIATFDVGVNTALSVGAVPRGTYYVRVRAANYTGASAASNEVVVVVP